MISKTNEQALESCIERHLVGSSREDRLASDAEPFPIADAGLRPRYGHLAYEAGESGDYDKAYCLDRKQLWAFLEATQAAELVKIQRHHDWQRMILERLKRKIDQEGVLNILKKGLDIEDVHLTFLYRPAQNRLNPEIESKFAANRFSITRQLYYSEARPHDSLDMAIFINGLPVATLELKNPWTGQNVHHARKQYSEQRDAQDPLLQFGRCLVHFAVDPDEVAMTTRLDGKNTIFLPFNKGFMNGKGNPTDPSGHKTSYLWKDILQKRTLADIILNYVKATEEKDKKSRAVKRSLYFPRYHQLDVVRRILSHAQESGPGQSYLIQHSAGSGKSNSIIWLAFQLVELYDKSGEKNLFDTVILVVDRRVLNKQLKDNITLFAEWRNLHAFCNSSQELKSHLEAGKKLILTTIQKFPFIVDGIQDLRDRKFAVIIDEAHSSQSGTAADNLNVTLGAEREEEEPEGDREEPLDLQDLILQAMSGRKMSPNASYLAFTATPKKATLEKFGLKGSDGKFRPFDLYSMKQAIEEEFILDVLANYTTYKSYYELRKSSEENPLFDTAKAQKKLKAYVEGHRESIAVKARIMLDHFVQQVWQGRKLQGKAKAMVVTRNIECAIRYFQEIKKILAADQLPFKAVIAFSGKKTIDGIEHTEDSLNAFNDPDIPAGDIPEHFRKDEYKLLVVANKYLTGFDEPLLHSMYVDKKLQGVLAVQTLSRLNRCNKKLGKQDTFVLDFYNSVEEIKSAFDDFYTASSLNQATNVNVLHDILDALGKYVLYGDTELKDFNQRFFQGADGEALSPVLDAVVARFDLELDDEAKIDFKIKAKQFVKIYSHVACLIPFNNVRWEMQHWFLKFLIPKLKVKDKEGEKLDELLESVDLNTYGLQRVRLNQSIPLNPEETILKPESLNVRGNHDEPEKNPLDEIIAACNDKHFSGWSATPEEQRVKLVSLLRQIRDNAKLKSQVMNNPDAQNGQIAFDSILTEVMMKQREQDLELYRLYAKDPSFKDALKHTLFRLLKEEDSAQEKKIAGG